jgi:hypothetical protein
MQEPSGGRLVVILRWIAIATGTLGMVAVFSAMWVDGPADDFLTNCGLALVFFGVPALVAAVLAWHLERTAGTDHLTD